MPSNIIRIIIKVILTISIVIWFFHFSISEKTRSSRNKILTLFTKVTQQASQIKPQTNILKNPSFENNVKNKDLPDNWKVAGLKLTSTQSLDQDYSLTSKDTKKTRIKEAHQSMNKILITGTKLQFSAWAKTTRAIIDNPNNKYAPKIRLEITAKYIDGSTQNSFASFNPRKSDWQQAITTIKLNKPTYRITVSVQYTQQTGIVYFDELSLKILN